VPTPLTNGKGAPQDRGGPSRIQARPWAGGAVGAKPRPSAEGGRGPCEEAGVQPEPTNAKGILVGGLLAGSPTVAPAVAGSAGAGAVFVGYGRPAR
jgi:hypothetical protein